MAIANVSFDWVVIAFAFFLFDLTPSGLQQARLGKGSERRLQRKRPGSNPGLTESAAGRGGRQRADFSSQQAR